MLKEVLSRFGEKQRQFLLLRMVGVNYTAALSALSIPLGTYKKWVHQTHFQGVYREIEKLGVENHDEALLMLRYTNYALVVQLEEDMLRKLLQEIKDNKPVFSKTNLGREIYARLANEMSTKPSIVKNMTWEQLILNQGENPNQLTQGAIGGIIEAETSPIEESSESESKTDSIQ